MFELKDCTVEESKIAGLKIIRSKTVTDDRGKVVSYESISFIQL
ncbi:hypothetical protein [Enterococcus cecorum]